TSIPHELLGIDSSCAVASLFAPEDQEQYELAKLVFEDTFEQFGLIVKSYREVPINRDALFSETQKSIPRIVQAFIKRPNHCRTQASFDSLLYNAKQQVRYMGQKRGINKEFFFNSLSSSTIIYKALCTSSQLEEFYLDLKNPLFKTNLVLFHRRFSTNTLPSWQLVQPFRLIAHNGEINTIEGNRAAAVSREKSLGLRRDQILTRRGSSDSANFNDMVEALKYRSSISLLKDILAIMIPPAGQDESRYFKFWSRAMEPWDGPALITYTDGKYIGARLDRSGFRPCRWQMNDEYITVCSEAGAFEFEQSEMTECGILSAGKSINIHLLSGEVDFLNPHRSSRNENVIFDARLEKLPYLTPLNGNSHYENMMSTFYFTKEDLKNELIPIIENGVGPIGSMGDTATIPALSVVHRSIYDYFFQDFAQVTNPPLDYIREKMVTSLKVYLGRKPNIFYPNEMIPVFKAIELKTPILSLGQMEHISDHQNSSLINICFKRTNDVKDFMQAIDECVAKAVLAVQNGKTILILSDRSAYYETPAIPSIIVMRAVQIKLNRLGLRLRVSVIVDSGEIRNCHQIAVLISFGASAICPYLALDFARSDKDLKFKKDYTVDDKELRLIKAFGSGLLKIMAKRGISVVRSYQGSELFTILGLGSEILLELFNKHQLTLGGMSFQNLLDNIMNRTEQTKDGKIPNNFIYKEHAAGKIGEKHSLTTKKTKLLHNILRDEFAGVESAAWKFFKSEVRKFPINIRDLFSFKVNKINNLQIQSRSEILKKFGSGAMSYGSISAESQRDIFLAMNEVHGRSNSGEGGENPYYYSDGITAKIKQIASGRFGVTAEYLVAANEVQIKIAQGAKPGEGGQLMGIKVDEKIAKARFSNPGVSLISPPPHHDIYSIEDLKQLIYEIKQLKPGIRVGVKLVAGKHIGPISLGVAKAGADIIHVSGGNGGTGAANLMSMKHAGLPWEIGLKEVHEQLSEARLRENVILRVDGGLICGDDIIMGAIYGADEFDFGKMLLVSQGCIMARVCEKNICPAGIATQDKKFKKRYKGEVDQVVKYLNYVAEDVRQLLAETGIASLADLIGRTDLLIINPKSYDFIETTKLDLDFFLHGLAQKGFSSFSTQFDTEINSLNLKIINDFKENKNNQSYNIKSTDRAIPVSINGLLAQEVVNKREELGFNNQEVLQEKTVCLNFTGHAGQGFGVFNMKGVELRLKGSANDSVAKGMSGGKIVIMSSEGAKFKASENVLIGNTCLYGATGGSLYLNGNAGDRFCVRNSGATVVVESVGLHACEYMTGGAVVILGHTLGNIGAGMTGGNIYTIKENISKRNKDFLLTQDLTNKDKEFLQETLNDFKNETNSKTKIKIEDLVKLTSI
ncbi:MAG: glutamate synthase domain-containing protein 2/glutamate synthase domain-containing protein 3, partial [Thermoproteota archaeon]